MHSVIELYVKTICKASSKNFINQNTHFVFMHKKCTQAQMESTPTRMYLHASHTNTLVTIHNPYLARKENNTCVITENENSLNIIF